MESRGASIGAGGAGDAEKDRVDTGIRVQTFRFSVGTYTIAPKHSLELKVIVGGSSGDDMWFAYDTGPYRSRVAVSASPSATARSGAVPASLVACGLRGIWARHLFP